MLTQSLLPLLCMGLVLLLLCTDASAGEEVRKDTLTDRDYYVYTPATLDPQKTYWLVVGVHGYKSNGKNAAGLAGWADQHDCIVVGPSFPNEGYQTMDHRSDEQLLAVFRELSKSYKLHPKLYIFGFSGGAQYAHRFMMRYPQLVVGCSAHSAGTWATGSPWHSVNPKASHIPFVMSCGENDTAKSFEGAAYPRIEWAKLFESQLRAAGFFYRAKFLPDVAHRQTDVVKQMTLDCFKTATDLMPYFSQVFTEISRLERTGKRADALKLAQEAAAREPLSEDSLSKEVVDEARKKLDPIIARLSR